MRSRLAWSVPLAALVAALAAALTAAPAAAQHGHSHDPDDEGSGLGPDAPAGPPKPEWLERLPEMKIPGMPELPRPPEVPAEERRGLLWKATSPAGATVWLTAGVHVGAEVVYPVPPAVEKAFEISDVVAIEADPHVSDRNLEKLELTQAKLPKGETLRSRLSGPQYEATARLFTELGLGLEMFEGFAPWFVARTLRDGLIERDGQRHAKGLDGYFVRKAKGRKVVELEGHARRIRAFVEVGARHPDALIGWAVQDARRVSVDGVTVEERWTRGDEAAVQASLEAPRRAAPALAPVYAALRDARAARLVDALERQAAPERTVFAVIADERLLGAEGVIAQLARRGWTVERVAQP